MPATRHVAHSACHLRKVLTGRPVNGLHLPQHGQLFPVPVLLQLSPDVAGYLRRAFPCRVDIVASAPELPVPVSILECRIPLVNHQAALSLEVDKSRDGHLGRYLEKHVHMVGADLRLDDVYLLPFAEFTEDFPDFPAPLPVEDLPSELGGENDMVLAVPRRVGKRVVISIIHL